MLKIVTDGAADMPEEWREKYQIHVIPLRVSFGEKTYTAGINLHFEDFYRLVHETRIIPKTSLPSPGQIADFYRGIAEKGDEILSMHITARLSGTFSTVQSAANELKDELNIFPFDSGAGSAALGLMCREARMLNWAGFTTEQILRRMALIRERIMIYFTIDNLEFARLNGRVSFLQNGLSSLLKIKPIIVLKDGLLEMADKVRTRQRAIDKVIQSVKERLGNHPVNIAVVHACDPEAAKAILERLHSILNVRVAVITDLAIPVAANLGPGTLGIVAIPVEEEILMTTQSPDILSSLEKNLQRSLRPVQPNQEFVNRLHTRLVNPNKTVLERYTSETLAAPVFFLVGFGLAVGLFLVWAIRQLR